MCALRTAQLFSEERNLGIQTGKSNAHLPRSKISVNTSIPCGIATLSVTPHPAVLSRTPFCRYRLSLPAAAARRAAVSVVTKFISS
jgi:hypothetical protein